MKRNQAEEKVIADFKKRAAEFASLVRDVASKPKRRNVHDLRVVIRRFSMDRWLAAHRPKAKGSKKALKKLNALLGERRQLDVVAGDAKKAGASCQKLKKRRDGVDRDLKKFLKSKHNRRVFRSLEDAALSTKEISALEERRMKLQTRLKECLLRPLRSKRDYHRLRIEIKKARYGFETLGYETIQLKKLQDLLGRLHDMEVLEQMVGKTAFGSQTAEKEKAKVSRLLPRVRRSAR